jgi:beta-glucosidase
MADGGAVVADGAGGGSLDGTMPGTDATTVTGDGAAPPPGDAATSVPGDASTITGLDTPAVEAMVSKLVAAMSNAQKAGQMVMLEYTNGLAGAVSPSDVASAGLGALLAGANDAPGNNMPSDWLNLTNQYKAAANALNIPIIFGIDAVHGTAKVQGATVFPHGIGMGCTRDAKLVQQVEQATASELVEMGINMSFSPDSDVGQDERWGRTYESFGEDPTLVSTMVTAAVTGYQTPHLGAAGTVLACPKHVLGAGGTTWGTGVEGGIDQGDTELTEAQMSAVHLPPFQAAIDAGAMAMMVSYSSWNGTKMSASTEWLTNVIKTELGYKGFLLSDFNAIQQLSGSSQQQEATAINAGLDMIMMSTGYAQFISDIQSLVTAGTIPQSRIDDAVTRILRAKVIAGLFGAPTPSGSFSNVGSAANRQVARQAVRESAVLLQNNNNALPLKKSAQILVAGAGTDLGVQSGGWTLGWQGVTNITVPTTSASIAGTTLVTALQNAATSSSLVTWNFDPTSIPAGTQEIVVVLYENPYAEFLGDTNDPNFSNTGTGQNPSGNTIYNAAVPGIVSDIKAANTSNLPLVLVLMTGRPIRIQAYLSTFDAVVAAWLPGSEGEGLADLLYGDTKFTGTLSKSWPTDSTTLPISSLQSGAAPLYAFGYAQASP